MQYLLNMGMIAHNNKEEEKKKDKIS